MFNLKVYHYAVQNFPEFSGYKSRVFPGQEPPRIYEVIPRRIELPEEFENELKHIGSKHRKTIFIAVASENID